MLNPITIGFALDTTDATVPLGFEAWINDVKFHDTDHVTGLEQITTEISDDDAEHELRFVLKHKLPEHTRVDETGTIVSDARLVVKDLAFDEIALGHMVTEQAMYTHDFNGTGPSTQDKFYGELGCNGTVNLKFNTPIYLWLLEHM
jgi:hypothetical protein